MCVAAELAILKPPAHSPSAMNDARAVSRGETASRHFGTFVAIEGQDLR
jgi:hypothetical protein